MEKKPMTFAAAAAVLGGVVFVLQTPVKHRDGATPQRLSEQHNTPRIVSEEGIHWHVDLTITINGAKQVIPANIGIGTQYADDPRYDTMMGMTAMHTHDDSGKLHWEVMNGPVREEDVRLSEFFRIWGKTFTRTCIFEYCHGGGKEVRFFVNGAPNSAYEKYTIRDSDRIEIRYE